MKKSSYKEHLDSITLDIEFLVISVIQGVALGTLAENITKYVANFQFEYWPYILAGFLLVLTFWSQAIIHALSFIDWPLDMLHSMLYFLVSLIEIMAFHFIGQPLLWFGFNLGFFVAAGLLYLWDLKMINQHRDLFKGSPARLALYKHMYTRQLFEMKVILPLGIIFITGCFLLILNFPDFFINQHYHPVLGVLQALIGLGVLIDSVINFKRRAVLIGRLEAI